MPSIRLAFLRSAALAPFLALCLASTAAAGAGLSIEYRAARDDGSARVESLLRHPDALPAMRDIVNELVAFDEPVTLVVGADDGPYYDPNTQEITLPYAFAEDIESRFAEATDLGPDELDTIVLDVVQHTLFHEIGHALVFQHELPILAREEDAVDALASVLLLEHVENGSDIATSAADMFGLEDGDVEAFDDDDFRGEHSLDAQRYFATWCHVYGADPDGQAELIDGERLTEERAERCIDDYERLRESWLSVLEPYRP